MYNLFHIRELLIGRPLLCSADYAAVITSVLADRIGVEPSVSASVINTYRRPNLSPVLHKDSGVVVYPVVGAMAHRGSGVSADSGLQSYTAMHSELNTLMADNDVKGILLDGDTSGGEASGITELADWIRAASEEKPIWSIANTRLLSGGYWLASATQRIVAAPMSSVGSIGVVTLHQDISGAMKKKGVVTTLVYAGDRKVDGNPYGPLPDNVRLAVQDGIDAMYAEFVGAVTKYRNIDEKVVRDTRAGVYGPNEALALGLVDDIGTLGSTIEKMAAEINSPFFSGVTFNEDTMAEEKKYTQADMDTAISASAAKAAADERKELVTDLTALAEGDERIGVFCEALDGGAKPALASSLAARISSARAKIETPAAPKVSASQADLDAFMASHAPNVSSNGPSNDGGAGDREKRLDRIRANAASYNKANGYI